MKNRPKLHQGQMVRHVNGELCRIYTRKEAYDRRWWTVLIDGEIGYRTTLVTGPMSWIGEGELSRITMKEVSGAKYREA